MVLYLLLCVLMEIISIVMLLLVISVTNGSVAPMLTLSSIVGTGSISYDLLGVCEINFFTTSAVTKLSQSKCP